MTITALAIGGSTLAVLYIIVKALHLRVPADAYDDTQDDPRPAQILRDAMKGVGR